MSSFEAARSPIIQSPGDASRLVASVGLALALSYAVFLAGSFVQGYWLIDQHGYGIGNDFVNLWAAGHLTLEGHPAAAYDWDLQRQAQIVGVGHPFDGDGAWPYPPPFLFAAALLASIPYIAASASWLIATASAYVLAVRNILGGRTGLLFACGFPGALWNVTAGQSGFLSAALLAGALASIERHPIFAGCCLGLLTYKPHLGLLFPLVLAVAARWRVIIAATATALMLAAASWLVFGSDTWQAFAHALSAVNQRTLADGGAGWNKLQTIYGLVRTLGGGDALAWTAQGVTTFGIAAWLCALWRTRTPFDLRVAALGVGALLATPYLFIYDTVVLAVPTAFFLRFALAHGLSRREGALLVIAGALILSYLHITAQVGLAATLIVAFLIAHRAAQTGSGSAQ
jgi:arabinofuranan 3-O-arabinosyltransferase